MSLEAIEKITQTESRLREEKTAAENAVRTMKEEAVREGEMLLRTVRAQAAEKERELLAQAEERAVKRGEEITAAAVREEEELRKSAQQNLAQAVEFIMERVVKS